VQNKLNV